ncbi:MAG TPA: cytochrome c [Terriglobales bacterium]|nr:cytochrome c [Terriglobales bacterium]
MKKLAWANRVPGKTALQRTSLILLILLLSVFVLWGQASKEPPPANAKDAEYKIPPEDAAKPNPVKPSAESHARGKKLYGYDCAMCHGKDGDGKGDMAEDMKNMPDFTHPDSLKGRTDGELFYIIRNGKGENMPPEGDRAKDEDVWNMVNYVRSLAKK